MATPCTEIYRSVTLAPGEQFNLPPGAELLGATTISDITSTCPLPSNLEELDCYLFSMLANVENLDATYVWEGCGGDCNAYLESITVAGITYPISPALTADDRGKFDVAGLASFISTNASISGVLLNISGSTDYDYPRGGAATLCFKTFPSVAQDTYVTLATYLQGLGTPTPSTKVRVYAQLRSDYIAGGTPAATCNCS